LSEKICNVRASNSVWYCVGTGRTLVCIDIHIHQEAGKPNNRMQRRG
jgi:hypothetical protein